MKAEKPQILSSTVSNIRNAPGRFIKQDSDTKQWYNVGDFLAKEKISQIFRDLIQSKKRLRVDVKQNLVRRSRINENIISKNKRQQVHFTVS